MLAYLGLACGYATVHDAVGDDLLNAAVQAALDSELIPAVPAADGLSAVDDARSSLRRFANSAVPHRLSQVGSGGSAKLPQRLSAVVDSSVSAGRTPIWSAGVVAGWAHAVQRDDVDDPRSSRVRSALAGHADDRARALLAACDLTSDAAQHELMVDSVSWWLKSLDHRDIRQIVRSALEET
jgi:fructuronate reductase